MKHGGPRVQDEMLHLEVVHGTLLIVPWPGLITGPHCGIGSSVLLDAKEKRGVITDTNKQGWGCSFMAEGTNVYEALGSRPGMPKTNKNKQTQCYNNPSHTNIWSVASSALSAPSRLEFTIAGPRASSKPGNTVNCENALGSLP